MEDIFDLAKAYERGEASPVSIVRTLLERISTSTVNAYITVLAEEAMRAAEIAEKEFMQGRVKGPLHGVPIAVKDLINVGGHRTTMGSEQYLDFIPREDAPAVSRLKEAGAIIIGKANTHQFAYGSTGDRSYFGPVRNPHDEQRISGGSSSGSAAAVAAGLAYAALGTDTSASIRLPAALCGIVGMKATAGLIPKEGVFSLADTLDHVGPMSISVRDNALLLGIISGRGQQAYMGELDVKLDGKVIGIPDGFFYDYLSPEVQQAMRSAMQALATQGVSFRTVSIPCIDDIYNAQQLVLKAEAYAQHQGPLDAGAPYDAEIHARLLTGRNVLAADYLQAIRFRPKAQQSFDRALDGLDALLTATCGTTAVPIGERSTALNGEHYPTPWLLTRLTAPTNFSGHPSLSVPYGTDGRGLPIGVQLIGKRHDEAGLYGLAHKLEQACWRKPAA